MKRVVTALALALVLFMPQQTAAIQAGSARALYCAYGGIGLRPNPLPPGYETEFAVAVVEIESPREIRNLAVSTFVLLNRAGRETKTTRVVKVGEFDRPRTPAEGEAAYYLNDGNTRPWNGVLPVGKIRLRVRVALAGRPVEPVRFRLTVGATVIEGAVNASWPT